MIGECREGVVAEQDSVWSEGHVSLDHPADRGLVAGLYPGKLLRRVLCTSPFDDQGTVTDSVGSVVRGQSVNKGAESIALLPLQLASRQLASTERGARWGDRAVCSSIPQTLKLVGPWSSANQ